MPTTTLARSVWLRRLLTLLAAGVLVLAACSTGDDGATLRSTDSGGEDVAAEAALGEGEAPTEADDSPPAGGIDLVAATDGRQIISTAHVDLSAPNADEVAGQIADLAVEVGGFVSGEDTSRVDGTRTTLVLRVPPEEFDAVLERLAELGELTAQRIETDEVTQQVVDLESRITTAEASVVRLRALLDRTGSVAEIAQVETELLARETTLETLRGQLRTIERQVDLATITVQVDSEDPTPVVDEDEGLPSFLGGLTSGWDALVLTSAAVAALFGVLLPWLVVVALLGLPVWWVVRSRRRSAAAEPSAA
jgi:hypothetical protein